MLQRIDITLDKQVIGKRFYGEEARTRNVDAMCIPKVLDGCSCRGFEKRNVKLISSSMESVLKRVLEGREVSMERELRTFSSHLSGEFYAEKR